MMIIGGEATHHKFVVDVSDSKAVEELFQRVDTVFSEPPHVLVNCAAILRRSPILDMAEEEYDKVLQTNLKV